MTRVKDDLQAQLHALRERYRDTLPAKRTLISSLMDECRQSAWRNATTIDALRESVHRLAGSAGSYDMETLGAAAALFEAQIRGVLEGNGTWAVEQAFAEFATILDAHAAATPVEDGNTTEQ
ncbi:MAG: Hpt domain-containing protein [Gammaproteobacteria bacterium]